jgi:Polyketide cyclase / dehydrase and lipid transport
MPTPLRIAAEVTVDAEPGRVWRAAVDWPRQREWIWATRVTGGQGTGAEVTGWTGIGPIGFTDPMVITEWDPPRRCVLRHTGRVVRGTGIFEVIPRGPRSEFRWIEQLQLPVPPAVGRLAGRVITPVAAWALRSSLRRFARLLPGRPPQD